MPRLSDPVYLQFPFRVGPEGPRTSARSPHVREQIEQVLFTDPGERIFHPEFGVGVRALLFEPIASPLVALAKKRLIGSLAAALREEVDPRTLEVAVARDDERLRVDIAYALAAIGHREHHSLSLGPGSPSIG